MTEADIMHLYGKSVYQIRLEMAERLFGADGYKADLALKKADEFVSALQAEDDDELKDRF